jgi:hypothetical protein
MKTRAAVYARKSTEQNVDLAHLIGAATRVRSSDGTVILSYSRS